MLWTLESSDISQGDGKDSSLILGQENPYRSHVSHLASIPREEELLNASSILAFKPDLRTKSYAAQIAYDEYCHLISQTYFFEILGFQVLSSMALVAHRFSFLHEVAAQAIDEARHIAVYRSAMQHLSYQTPISESIPKIFEKIANAASLPEKAVKGFLILESLAVGLFGARVSFFSSSLLTQVDKIILAEEVRHQSHAVDVIASFMQEGVISLDEVTALMREGARDLTFEILPLAVVEKHSIEINQAQARELLAGGILRQSTALSRSNIRRNLSKIRSRLGDLTT